MARKKIFEKRYICIGENCNEYIKLGYCGEIHSLGEWLEILFPMKNAREYFEKDTEKTILEYIFIHRGKRLKAVEKWVKT